MTVFRALFHEGWPQYFGAYHKTASRLRVVGCNMPTCRDLRRERLKREETEV